MKNNFMPFPVLESDRLVLKQLTTEYAQDIFDYQSNKDNFPHSDMPVYTELSQAVDYIEKMNAGVGQGKWIIWGICLAKTEELIGTISIWNLNYELNKAEFGYGIFPKHRQNGYMKEALNLTIEFAFEIMEIQSLEAYTSHYNKPSINLLHKMNFEFLKTVEDEYSNGALMDVFTLYKST